MALKLLIIGATGNGGQALLQEALSRGHKVTATARDVTYFHPVGNVDTVKLDALDTTAVAQAARGHDAVLVAISGRKSGHDTVKAVAATLLKALPEANVSRLFWIGGAGSLEVAPGVRVVDTPDFPEAWKGEALGQAAVLDFLRSAETSVNWTYASPAALIGPGGRTGKYRVGADQLLTDANGVSTISWIDFAVAALDEIEQNTHLKQRVTYAY